MARYRWALRPGWILSHLFVLVCVVAFINLSLWQYSRLMGRRESNDMIRERQSEALVPVDEVMTAGSSPDDARDAIFRQVSISGTYATDDQVLIRNRSAHGSPGYWVVTPLTTGPGEAVAVNRGWIPIQTGDEASADFYAPPPGEVTVTGLVVDSQEQSGLGVTDPDGERLSTLSRVDVPRLEQQTADDLYPMFVNLVTQDPAQAGQLPEPVPPPELTDGSHLNYTGQWFIFAVLTVIVYPLLLRRTARNKAAEAAGVASDADPGEGSGPGGPGGPGSPDDDASPTTPGSADTGGGSELASSVPPR